MKLKELRAERGLTQKDLAKIVGVSSQTILNWESGIYEPSIAQIIKLADYFDITTDELLEHGPSSSQIDYIGRSLQKVDYDQLVEFIKKQLKEMGGH